MQIPTTRLTATLLLAALTPAAWSATLLSDTFSTSTLDASKYAIQRASNASVSGGSLIDIANAADLGMEVPSVATNFPNTVQVDATIKIPNPTTTARIATGVPETNAGFRILEAGAEGIGIEIFPFRGASDTDTLNIRRAVNWGNDVSANISPALTANQLVVLRGVVNGANVTATLFDLNTSATLATVSTTVSALGVTNTSGALRLTTYNQANVEFLNVKATNTANAAVLVNDDFNGSALDQSTWWTPATDQVANTAASATSGSAVLTGNDGSNNPLTALLPTRSQFSNFEMQSVWKVTNRGPNGYGNFSVQFRETNNLSAFYQLAVFPQTGHTVGDGQTTYTSPCVVLRKGIAAGTYTNLASVPITPPSNGSTLVLNLLANGNTLTFYTGPNKTTAYQGSATVTDSTNTTGFVKFTSFGLTTMELDEYQIATVGSNILPPIATAADNEWMLLQ
jgi:hypothetical protein